MDLPLVITPSDKCDNNDSETPSVKVSGDIPKSQETPKSRSQDVLVDVTPPSPQSTESSKSVSAPPEIPQLRRSTWVRHPPDRLDL